jgi:CheY-like chemotaxis protein
MAAARKLILYAEDDADDVFLVARLVKNSNLPVELAFVRDGQDAIDWLNGSDKFADREQFPLPVLLITDLKMPKIDGLELLSLVRGNPKFDSLPVIIHSSSDLEQDHNRCRQLGANEYVVKDSLGEKLLMTVKRVLGQAAAAAVA